MFDGNSDELILFIITTNLLLITTYINDQTELYKNKTKSTNCRLDSEENEIIYKDFFDRKVLVQLGCKRS